MPYTHSPNSVVRITGVCSTRSWFIMYLDQESRCLSILSDHGNFNHRWPREDGDFVAFILDREEEFDYVIRNITTEEERRRVDEKATRRELRKFVAEEARASAIRTEEAREAMREIAEWGLEEYDTPASLAEICCGNFADLFRFKPSYLYHTLHDELLPAARAEWQAHLAAEEASRAHCAKYPLHAALSTWRGTVASLGSFFDFLEEEGWSNERHNYRPPAAVIGKFLDIGPKELEKEKVRMLDEVRDQAK